MNSLKFIENLKVTQDGFRCPFEKLVEMADFADANIFPDIKKIAIVDTGDGNFWIRDGLHRCAAILMACREFHESEFIIEKYTYEQINSINLSVKYYTPFDLKTEVRLADFFSFKNLVDKQENKEEFIRNNSDLYKTARQPYHESLHKFILAQGLIRLGLK